MAFDQNSISMDLSPINIGRSTVIEESRINAPPTSGRNNNTTEGFYANSTSPGSMPVYYPASDAGEFVGVGYGNAAVQPGWVQRIPPAVVSAPGITSPSGYCYRLPNVPNRVGGNCSDKASDEGGDDLASGKKIKFLCSFGGKILPRPSDGALRYVGGHTRIISVSRDVGFNQLVQKLGDLYGQNVVIKYQLPEEDLDALVSVSCPDDLENMMDEYEKMLKRSLDKSAKLRVFLFLASDLDSSGIIQMGDFQDSGQEYVEAVNGIMDGLGIGSIMRESITSAASTQISESSGNEAIDHTGGHAQIDFTGPPSTGGLSPKNGPATTQEASPVCVDPNPTISVAPLGIQMVRPPLPTLTTQPVAVVQPQQQQQTGFDMLQQQHEMGFPPRASYLQAYVDPLQEALNHTNYVQYPSQMGFPAQLLGTVGPMFTQQQYRDNAVNVSPHQFIPAIHMTTTPSSHASITKNAVQPIVQPQQIQVEHYPEENMYRHRVVHVPGDQSYNKYHAQVAPAVMGGYGWHQAPQPDQITFSELPHQEVLTEKVSRFNDCYMCQKALPHAHSDTEVQAQKDSPTATMPDFNSVHHSLQLEDNIRGQQPLNKAAVTGPMGEGIVENQVAGTCSRVLDHMDHEAIKAQYGGVVVSQNFKNDRTVLQREENHEPSVPQGVVGLASGPQCPYGAFVGTVPQLYQENVIQKPMVPPTQYQEVKEEALMNKAVNVDNASGGDTASQTSDHLVVNESPKVYSDNLPASVPKESMRESSFAYDQLRQIDGRMENLGVRPSEFFLNNEQVLSPVDNNSRREDVLDNNRAQQIPYSRNFQKVDEYEMKQQPLLVNNTGYPQPRPVIKHLGPNDISYGNLASFSLSPVNQVGHLQDNSNSLFSNQDPWNMPHDTHFPPPRPNKFLTRKEAPVVRDPFSDNRFGNTGESPSGNIIGGLTSELLLQDGVHQPSGNLDTDYTVQSNKGSAEENIKQELQAVAEGVAASVLNPDSAIHGRSGDAEAQNSDVEGQHTDNKREDVKPKLPEKGNLGFPVSDGIGRLQIIKNIDLEELRELGSGTFGTVYHGKWRGSDVAIKRINERCFAGKPSEQDRMRDDFWNEAIKLADLHHPNVVAFYGVVVDGPGDSVATVTEYMVNGSLRTALQKNKRNLDKRKRLLIAMDVAFGMEYLHGKNIVHFDLKSDNLLVNLRDPHRPICKVGDLGLSKVKCQTLISGGVRGTLPWMAPELLNGGNSLVSEKVDVFSFGIVLWELLTGDEPYAELHYGAIIGGIVSNTLRPPVPENCDPEWRSLMERCWSAEPTERLNFTEIADQLRSMAAKLPSKAQAQQQQQPTSTQTQIMN